MGIHSRGECGLNADENPSVKWAFTLEVNLGECGLNVDENPSVNGAVEFLIKSNVHQFKDTINCEYSACLACTKFSGIWGLFCSG